MTRGPLESEIQEIITGAFERAPDVLRAQFEDRPGFTQEETTRVHLEMIGALRDCVVRLAREVDDLRDRS